MYVGVCVCLAERTGAVLCSIHQVTPICMCVCLAERTGAVLCSIHQVTPICMCVCVCVWQKGLVQYCVRFIR